MCHYKPCFEVRLAFLSYDKSRLISVSVYASSRLYIYIYIYKKEKKKTSFLH